MYFKSLLNPLYSSGGLSKKLTGCQNKVVQKVNPKSKVQYVNRNLQKLSKVPTDIRRHKLHFYPNGYSLRKNMKGR